MKKMFLCTWLLFSAAAAKCQNDTDLVKDHIVGMQLTNTRFEGNSIFKTGRTIDAEIKENFIFVHEDNWFPVHFTAAPSMKKFLITVNCKLDQRWFLTNTGRRRLNHSRAIVFEGYSPDQDQVRGVYLAQCLTAKLNPTTQQIEVRGKISIGVQDGPNFTPAITLDDTPDGQFHDYRMAIVDAEYYFFKDKRLLCKLNEKQPDYKLDAVNSYHTIFVENNVKKNFSDYFQVRSVTVNELVARQDIAPLKIEILNPDSDGDTLTLANGGNIIEGQARSNAGIASIFINDAEVKFQSNGFFIYQYDEPRYMLRMAVTSKSGMIATKTYFVKQSGQSGNMKRDYHPEMLPKFKPKFYALIFACRDYVKPPRVPIPNCLNDSKKLADVLEKYYQFDHSAVQILQNVTRDTISTAIQNTAARMTDGDNLLIAFSGHGSYNNDDTNPVGYWIPINVDKEDDYVSSDQVRNWLGRCNAQHILILSNSCYSAAFMGDHGIEPTFDEQRSYDLKSVKVISAGGVEEVSVDNQFIPAITRYLTQNALSKNKYYFTPEFLLFSQIEHDLQESSPTIPRINYFKTRNNQNGDFYFILKGPKIN